jgi:predicted SAM-dependent methyltransferase
MLEKAILIGLLIHTCKGRQYMNKPTTLKKCMRALAWACALAFGTWGLQAASAASPVTTVPMVRTPKPSLKPIDASAFKVTANNMGFEDIVVNDLPEKYLAFVPSSKGHLMDIGCAWGFAIDQVLKIEKSSPFLLPAHRKIFAVDMGKEHLEAIGRRMPPGIVQTVEMKFPLVETAGSREAFTPDSLGAVYAGLVLHYLNGDALRQGLKLLYAAMIPGGRLYVSTGSAKDLPPKLANEFKQRKDKNVRDPGWFPDIKSVPAGRSTPDYINVFDQDTMAGYLTEAGFTVKETFYFKRANAMTLLATIAEK